MVSIMAILLVAPAFAAQQEIGTITVPMNGSSLYRVDPDDQVKTIRDQKVTIKNTVAPYAKNGFVTGNAAKQNVLKFGLETNKVRIYGVTTVNANLIPEEARQLDAVAMANYFIAKCTRIEMGGTCLNVEPYNSNVHTGVVDIAVGTKKAEYWTVFLRNDGVWTLCIKGKGGSKPQPTQQPTEQPQPTPTPTAEPVDPEPVWEDPDPTPTPTPVATEEPWDPDFVWEDPTPSPAPTEEDPEPIWEDPDPTPAPTPAPQQDWDQDFNLDPEPQWEEPDPTPAQTPAPQQDWDTGFNLDPEPQWEDPDPAPQQAQQPQADPEPVWENPEPAPQAAPEPTQSWDSDFNFGEEQPQAAPQAQADPEVIWEDPAPAAPQAAPEPQADPEPVFEDNEPAPQSQPDPSDGWDDGFNF